MTPDLLLYLESRMVLHQGLINARHLRPSDLVAIRQYVAEGHMEYIPIKNPEKVKNPMFTHRIRFSESLYRKAWHTRLAKAEQFTPTLDSRESKVTSHEKNSRLFHQYQTFLKTHNAKLTPSQHEIAKAIFAELGKKKHGPWLSLPGSGKTWLFKSIDQFLTWKKES